MGKNLPHTIGERFPPSDPCGCDICKNFCQRPGWWTVAEAKATIDAGYGGRMMLEISPDLVFGVLSPAFRGCEGNFALQEFSRFGCNFLSNGLCQLHGTGHQPLECRFCHHSRKNLGTKCHMALEKDWHTPAGQSLVSGWAAATGLWQRYTFLRPSK